MNAILIISSFAIVAGIILLIFGAANTIVTKDMAFESDKRKAFLIAGIVLTAVGVTIFLGQFLRLMIRDRRLLREKLAKEAAQLEREQEQKANDLNSHQRLSTVGFY